MNCLAASANRCAPFSASARNAPLTRKRTPSSRASNSATPLSALRLARALPSVVRGPVDFSHGFQRRIAFACFARRTGVHDEAVPIPFLLVRFRRKASDCSPANDSVAHPAPELSNDIDTACGRDRDADPRLGERKPTGEAFLIKRSLIELNVVTFSPLWPFSNQPMPVQQAPGDQVQQSSIFRPQGLSLVGSSMIPPTDDRAVQNTCPVQIID